VDCLLITYLQSTKIGKG